MREGETLCCQITIWNKEWNVSFYAWLLKWLCYYEKAFSKDDLWRGDLDKSSLTISSGKRFFIIFMAFCPF